MPVTSKGHKLLASFVRSMRRKAGRHVTEAEAKVLVDQVSRIVWERRVK